MANYVADAQVHMLFSVSSLCNVNVTLVAHQTHKTDGGCDIAW